MTKLLGKALLITLVLSCSVALADDLVQRRTMGVVFRNHVPHLYFSARDLVNPDAVKKLDSGLPQRIVMQHYVYALGRAEPIAAGGHSCKIVYDLWQAVYRVEYEAFGAAPQSHSYAGRDEAIARCLVVRNVPLGEARDYAHARQIYVGSLIQLNPLSTSTVARIRRWLARPRGEYNVESKSFFGSFVSLFVNDRIGAAERVLRLRSQDVELR